MDALTLLDTLRSRGVTLTARGDRLTYRPLDAVTPDLLAALKEHKAALLARLTPPAQSWDWLIYMPTDRFRGGNYLVRLFSEVLQEEIALVSGPWLVARAKALGLVAYLPEEIAELARSPVDADSLRKLHAVKKRFNGTVSKGE